MPAHARTDDLSTWSATRPQQNTCLWSGCGGADHTAPPFYPCGWILPVFPQTCTGTCTIDSMPHQLSTAVQIVNQVKISTWASSRSGASMHACVQPAASQPAHYTAEPRPLWPGIAPGRARVVQDNQSCEGQASSGPDRATCPASGVARRRAPQPLSTYKNSRKAKRIATCPTWLRDDNNNTTSRNQTTTIPEDGNILETFRR